MAPEVRMPGSAIVVRPDPMDNATYTESSRLQDGLLHRDELRRMAFPVFARAGALFLTLATALDDGVGGPRASEFLQQLEAAVAQRLSNRRAPMRIPLATLVLVKR
jgi:hypothetical protein